jgi:hypothetical protein
MLEAIHSSAPRFVSAFLAVVSSSLLGVTHGRLENIRLDTLGKKLSPIA